jgi:hypothetical protein
LNTKNIIQLIHTILTKLIWHKNPQEAALLYSDNDPTYTIMPDGMGRFYSVRDILNRAAAAKERRISKRLENRLSATMQQPFWYDDDNNRVSPRQVIDDLDNPVYTTHKQRIENADLSYPALLRLNRSNKDIALIDGAHRLAKYLKERERGEASSFTYYPVTAKQIRSSLLASTANKKTPANERKVMGEMLNQMEEWQQKNANIAWQSLGNVIQKRRRTELFCKLSAFIRKSK